MICFLGGSLSIKSLELNAEQKLVELVQQGFSFTVGDADGADSAFQVRLASMQCNAVRVFYSGQSVRNNIGKWPNRRVESGYKSKGYAMHSAKDRAMGAGCEMGFMLWDGKSIGTIVNVLDLLEQGKNCWLAWSQLSEVAVVANFDEFKTLVEEVSPESWTQALDRFERFKRKKGRQSQSTLELDIDWGKQ